MPKEEEKRHIRMLVRDLEQQSQGGSEIDIKSLR